MIVRSRRRCSLKSLRNYKFKLKNAEIKLKRHSGSPTSREQIAITAEIIKSDEFMVSVQVGVQKSGDKTRALSNRLSKLNQETVPGTDV